MDFVTITSDNNWFKTHPEKVAGVEYQSSSIYFPLMVKGTKQDVLRVTGIKDIEKERKIKIAKAKATAFLLTQK